MNSIEEKLLKNIAEEHNVSVKTLKDIIKTSNKFAYENTTTGKRINEYHGLIKYAVNNSIK